MIGFVSDLTKPLSKEVIMQTVVTDPSSRNHNKSMDKMDSMTMENLQYKYNNCNLSDFASSYPGALKTHMKKTHWRKVQQMQPV